MPSPLVLAQDSRIVTSASPSETATAGEPTAREVNRKLRAERQAEKAANRRRMTGEGAYARLMEQIVKEVPGDPRKQIARFLDRSTITAVSRAPHRHPISQKTLTSYGAVLQRVVSNLTAIKRRPANISDIKRGAVVEMVRYWEQHLQLAEGTVTWQISVLRRFLVLIGKAGVIPCGSDWRTALKDKGVTAGTVGRSNIAVMQKGWADLGFDIQTLLSPLDSAYPWAHSCCELMWAFGLRFSEALQLEPVASDKSTYLLVYRGTKGGRHRQVAYSSSPAREAWQREVLERAKQRCTRRGTLAPVHYTLAQAKEALRYRLRRLGIHNGEGGLGITPHGLRHQFGTDSFQEITGLPAPVLGLLPPAAYAEREGEVRKALLYVSGQMGHARPYITGAYVGSVTKENSLGNARLRAWNEKLTACGETFRAAGVAEAWIAGRCAFGLAPARGESMSILVRPDGQDILAAQRALEQLDLALQSAIGCPVVSNLWLREARPEGFEILFGQDS
jgi:site-specific recombinase XerD